MRLPLSAVLVLFVYVGAVTALGTWLGRRGGTLRDYFLAGRSVPWWAIAACIVATETSTLTFIGVPGLAYLGDWTFLQLALGYVVGRIVIAAVLVPAYFSGDLYTSYELLQKRFGGAAVRGTAVAIFLVSRTLGDGIRLHAAGMVLSLVGGFPEWACVLVLGAAMIVYTEEGGVRATIWTDAIQMTVYLCGALVCVAAVARLVPGGLDGALVSAAAAGKLQWLSWSWDRTQPYTFAGGVVGGLFLNLATHGTDHYLVQRLLVARSRRDAAAGLVLSGVLVFAQFVLFLGLGTLLWVHYGGRSFARGDEVVPTFIAQELPGGLVGVILAAIVAAALSPSLNAMASSTLRDLYLPFVDPGASEARQMRVGRAFTVVWGVAQIAVALAARNLDSALNSGLAALGYASGPTVGAFLLGVLTRRADARGTLVGMLSGLVASLAAGMLAPWVFGMPGVAWTWNVAVGASATFAVGLAASRSRPAVSQ